MILTEEHVIHCKKSDELLQRVDGYCFQSKNLYNSANFLIRQCGRISRLLAEGEILTSLEKYAGSGNKGQGGIGGLHERHELPGRGETGEEEIRQEETRDPRHVPK